MFFFCFQRALSILRLCPQRRNNPTMSDIFGGPRADDLFSLWFFFSRFHSLALFVFCCCGCCRCCLFPPQPSEVLILLHSRCQRQLIITRAKRRALASHRRIAGSTGLAFNCCWPLLVTTTHDKLSANKHGTRISYDKMEI